MFERPKHCRHCSCPRCVIDRSPAAYARGVARAARYRLAHGIPRSRRLFVQSWDGATWGLSPHLDGPVEPRRGLTTGPGDLGEFVYVEETP